MPTFRAYVLSPTGKIAWGEWFEAGSVDDAKRIARSRCRGGIPTVELWQGGRLVGVHHCGEQEISRSKPGRPLRDTEPR